jgi:hypothetical protein
MRTAQYAILLLICLGATQAVAQVPDLKTVLERAVGYVSAYEEQLGSVIGDEDYSQTAVWGGGRSQRRRLSSEFLLTRVENNWFGVRNVLHVNNPELGTARQPPEVGDRYDFSAMFAQPPDQIVQKLNEIARSNTRYNIGDFVRTFNVPTYSLTILRPANFRRFTFERGSEGRIETILAWEVRFSEIAHPTMIRELNGNDQPQQGSFWIDPNTGRILKTETFIDAHTGRAHYRARFVVTYKLNKKLQILVPDKMQEKYDSEFHRVEGTATYSNFRRFETEVKLVPIEH